MRKIDILNPKILLSIPLALISLQIFLGIVFGYFIGKSFSGKKIGQSGRIKSLIFNIGSYKFHLHHWLWAFGLLIFAVFHNFFPFYSKFFFGFLGGLVFQGIRLDPNWYKILIKKK